MREITVGTWRVVVQEKLMRPEDRSPLFHPETWGQNAPRRAPSPSLPFSAYPQHSKNRVPRFAVFSWRREHLPVLIRSFPARQF